MKWKLINTAPKDGTRILLYLPKHDVVVSGMWDLIPGETLDGYKLYEDFYDWCIDDDLYIMDDPSEYPTQWMEMPELLEEII